MWNVALDIPKRAIVSDLLLDVLKKTEFNFGETDISYNIRQNLYKVRTCVGALSKYYDSG